MNKLILIFFIANFFNYAAYGKGSIKIFITSNLQGWFDSRDLFPTKKAKGIYYLHDEILTKKKQYPTSFLLDSGDFFYGSVRSFYALEKKENIFLEYFFALPYDAISLGNRDLEQITYLEKFLARKKFIASNLENSFLKNYILDSRKGKKILITALSYLENDLQKEGWKKKQWQKAILEIQKVVKKENPDLVIGLFHLSLFYRKNSYTPSIEQVLLEFSFFDFIVAGQSFYPSPNRRGEVTYILGTPVVRAGAEGSSFLEVNIDFLAKKKNYSFYQHFLEEKKKNQLSENFISYLNESSGWVYKKKKGNRKKCLENSFHKALGENWTLHPKLFLKPFSLNLADSLRRKHLFYWFPYFNRKAIANFSTYDFQKVREKEFKKKYFFTYSLEAPKDNFWGKYKKKYPVAINDYELREEGFIAKKLLQKAKDNSYSDEYIHILWFDYFKNYSPNSHCPMFEKK